jgi:hypothetical protein
MSDCFLLGRTGLRNEGQCGCCARPWTTPPGSMPTCRGRPGAIGWLCPDAMVHTCLSDACKAPYRTYPEVCHGLPPRRPPPAELAGRQVRAHPRPSPVPSPAERCSLLAALRPVTLAPECGAARRKVTPRAGGLGVASPPPDVRAGPGDIMRSPMQLSDHGIYGQDVAIRQPWTGEVGLGIDGRANRRAVAVSRRRLARPRKRRKGPLAQTRSRSSRGTLPRTAGDWQEGLP